MKKRKVTKVKITTSTRFNVEESYRSEGHTYKYFSHQATITVDVPGFGRELKYSEKVEFELSPQRLIEDMLFMYDYQVERKAESIKERLEGEVEGLVAEVLHV